MLKRVIMILAASLEFDRKVNSEIVERQSDNEEVPQVLFLKNSTLFFIILFLSSYILAY